MDITPSKEEIKEKVKIEDLFRYLNISDPDRVPEEIIKNIKESIKLFLDMVRPYVVFRGFNAFKVADEGIVIEDVFIKSAVLSKIASESRSIYICIVSNGDLIEKNVSMYYESNSFFMAQIADAYGSVLVEATLKAFLDKYERALRKEGIGLSAFYSPGYCDIEVEELKNIFGLLSRENTLVTLTRSGMMYPEKSIAGIFFGIEGEKADRFKKYYIFCDECNNRLCKYYKK